MSLRVKPTPPYPSRVLKLNRSFKFCGPKAKALDLVSKLGQVKTTGDVEYE